MAIEGDPAITKPLTKAYGQPAHWGPHKHPSTTAARACQIAFGYEQRITRHGLTRTYRHEGILDRPGARRVGQRVFLLNDADARALARELLALGLRVRIARIRVRPEDLAALGQGGQGPF